ncbi:NAD(P)/FAD-dependent oxidoreductase [Phycisphaera mikurensis]|uniref:Thioredoxin reductase n=1 Tax=Phycisphaera mikurensis (strain NBRC 102666 / KCTC 22515 / FYK2301M01) TaxID=1142394 RepID=I0IAI6_PHYMF|nr:FAD-dependent oxidoreductase [Phycisphaera mikurensis]MBB6441729.1 thioredoxin reductase (NADPH) [Phycisphaera mikurensis]BAM02274.1 thioredoxin reductase [Phycisphaera mikurensis NBRC 102666]
MSEQPPVEKVVIIGSGPAGWTAAIYAARADLKPLVFPGRAAKGLNPGGQLMLTSDVENYPGYPDGRTGPEMMHDFFHQAMRFGTRVVTDDGPKDADALAQDTLYQLFQDVAEVDLASRPFRVRGDRGHEVLAETVIIATGAKANWLGLENEKRLAESGGGVSACAVCDGALPMFRDQPLGVVGGGDTACEEATYLAKFASEVHLFVRRDELRASRVMADRVTGHEKIRIHWNTEVTDVAGDQKVTGVDTINNATGEAGHRELKGLFLAIGHTPITGFLRGQLPADEAGYLRVKDPGRSTTEVDGVFVCGDVADHVYRQAITAAGMGCKAAMDAERFLSEHGEAPEGIGSPEAQWAGATAEAGTETVRG